MMRRDIFGANLEHHSAGDADGKLDHKHEEEG